LQLIFRKVADVQKEKELIERQKNEPLELPTDHPLRKFIWRFRRRSERNLLSSPFAGNHGDIEVGSDAVSRVVSPTTAFTSRTSTARTSPTMPIDDEATAVLAAASRARMPADPSVNEYPPAVKNQSSTVSKWSRLVSVSSSAGSTSLAATGNRMSPVSTVINIEPIANRVSNATTASVASSTVAKATRPLVVSKWKRLTGGGGGISDPTRSESKPSDAGQLMDRQGAGSVVVTQAEINQPKTADDLFSKPGLRPSSDSSLRAELHVVTEQMNRVEMRLDAIFRMFTALVSGTGFETWLEAGAPGASPDMSAAMFRSRGNSIDLSAFTSSRVALAPPDAASSSSAYFQALSSAGLPANSSLTSPCLADRLEVNVCRPEAPGVNDLSDRMTRNDNMAFVIGRQSPPSVVGSLTPSSSGSSKPPRSLKRSSLSGTMNDALDIGPEMTAAENPAFLPSPDVFPEVSFPTSSNVMTRSQAATDSRVSGQQSQPSTSSQRHPFGRKTSLAQLSAIDLDPLPTSGDARVRVGSTGRSLSGARSAADSRNVADAATAPSRPPSGIEMDSERPPGGGTTPHKGGLRTTLV
jgi:hypothetical protein